MYCSTCGVAVGDGLTYCNHCGAKLKSEKVDSLVKTTELRAESLIMSSIVALFILGLFAISILLGVMKAVLKFEIGPLLAFAFLSFLILIALEGVLISKLFGRRHREREAPGRKEKPIHVTKELEASAPIAIETPSSVTEHTTRTFDPILSERK